MNRLIYAASSTCPDLRYETGFEACDPFLWFQTDTLNAMVVSKLEYGRAVKQRRKDVQVFEYEKLRSFFNLPEETPPEKDRDDFTRMMDAIVKGTNCRKWTVPECFPYGCVKHLLDLFLKVETVKPFSPARSIKTAAEIEAVRQAERLAETGLAAADGILAEASIGADDVLFYHGEVLTAERLRGAINAAIAMAGGAATGTIAAPGPQGADPHQAGSGPVRAHVPIIFDIFPQDQTTGYYGDLTRTRVKGAAPAHVQAAYEAVLEIQQRALERLKPGVLGTELQEMTENFFAERGYPEGCDEATGLHHGFFHGLGHAVGLEVHDQGPSLNKRGTVPLAPGHIVTVEPGIYYPEWGGIRIEDTVAITADGIDNLATAPKHLVIE